MGSLMDNDIFPTMLGIAAGFAAGAAIVNNVIFPALTGYTLLKALLLL